MDVEQFIEMVKERPCLYDNRDKLSKNKKVKESNWKEIAIAMKISSEVAKIKWKNLKDNYSKHLKSTSATSGYYLKYLHWAWAPNMEFMKKHINFTPAAINFDLSNHQDDHEYEHVDSAQSSLKSDSRSEETLIDNKRFSNHVSKQTEFPAGLHKPYQYIENGQYNGHDATDLIFLGYAKAIKTFSVRRQAEIKLKIAKIITDEEVAHYEETSMYPESPEYYSNSPSPQNDPLNSKNIEIKNEDTE